MEYELIIKVKCEPDVIGLITDKMMCNYAEIWQITQRKDKTKTKIRG